MAAAKKKEKPKSEYHPDNASKTFDKITHSVSQRARKVGMIDKDFSTRVADLLLDRFGDVDDAYLIKGSDSYNALVEEHGEAKAEAMREKAIEDIKEMTNTHYDVHNRFSPLNKLINKTEYKNASEDEKRLLKEVYMKHIDDVHDAIGEEDFLDEVDQLGKRNEARIKAEQIRSYSGRIGKLRKGEKDDIIDFLGKDLKYDSKHVSKDHMRQEIKELVQSHIARDDQYVLQMLQRPKLTKTHMLKTYGNHQNK